jgi:CRP/FNR family transcriptional regulator, cyclic AMP receptor protein
LDIAQILRDTPTFDHFSEADLGALVAALTSLRTPAGAEVVHQNEQSHDAYFILKGKVRIERDTTYGRYPLAVLEAGDLFGEASFIDQQGRSGDALTVVESDLLVFSPRTLAPVLEANPNLQLALYWAFWKSLSGKLRRANQHLVRFFSEAGGAPQQARTLDKSATGSFQVDLAAKRQLFEEQTLTPMEINFLSTLSKAKRLEPGEIIFREGEPGDRMYVVLEGRVMISKHIPGAGEEALAFVERGDYFGEMALIDKEPRSADAKAHEGGAVVLTIPREVVEGILDIRKVSSLRLLRILCSLVSKRLRELDEKIIGWFMLSGGRASGFDPQALDEQLPPLS